MNKTDELISKFFRGKINREMAIDCALGVCDEMIKEWNNESGRTAKQNYWKNIRKELLLKGQKEYNWDIYKLL